MRRIFQYVFIVFVIWLSGCADSGSPVVEDIVKVNPPTFSGSTNYTVTSAVQNYTLTGQCDVAGTLHQYSFNQSEWNTFTCSGGSFSISFVISGGFKEIWARSKGKFSFTDISRAKVSFILPATSNSVMAAMSAKSDDSDQVGAGTQNILAPNFEGNRINSGTQSVQTYLPRIVYEP